MFDFKINSKGDIVLEEESNPKEITFRFMISQNKIMKFNFNTLNTENKDKYDMVFSFDIGSKQVTTVNITGKEAFSQLVDIMLKTSLDEILDREDIGTELEIIKHKNLHDKVNIEFAAKTIQTGIDKIQNNLKVNIEPFVGIVDGRYIQTYMVLIYDIDNNLIYRNIIK